MKRTRRSARARTLGRSAGADALFDMARPIVRDAYEALLSAARPFGPVRIEAEDRSIQLHAGSAVDAFAVVKPRKIGILVRLCSVAPMTSLRVLKVERISADRVHNEVLITHTRAVDDELTSWLRTSYRLSSKTG